MKGTISKKLHAILSDEDGRKQLRRHLLERTDGEVTVGRIKYKVSLKNAGAVRSSSVKGSARHTSREQKGRAA